MDIKLIATDMDGTLLTDKHEVSENNIKKIKEAQQKGVKFILASGRPLYGMTKFIKPLDLDKYQGYLIAFNGGIIYDCQNKSVIFSQALENKQVEFLYEKAKEFNTSLLVYIDKDIYIYNPNPSALKEVELTGLKWYEFKDIKDIPLKNVIKCMMADDPEKIVKFQDKVKEYKKNMFITISLPIFLEFMHKDVDKGKTLTLLMKKLEINKENALAMGDSYNDISLLKAVNNPVAVLNAVDDIKKIAKYISKHHLEDAMADVIERYVK